MSKTDVKISVALVTRNRPASLERTLLSLRAQEVQPWETIVSDDSDNDNAISVKQLAATYGCQYIKGPHSGLYANRNRVALACTGTHIRTMDDDHEFPDNHMQRCLEAVVGDPASIWIIGEFNPSQDMTTAPQCPGQIHPRGFSVKPPDTENCWAISDGASIYPREIFDCGLRYIDDYKFGAAYLEFGSRLHWIGYRIRHLANSYVVHHFDAATRSSHNIETDLASRFCAMLCYSYLYKPTFTNKVLCQAEMLKQVVIYRRMALRAVLQGIVGFQKQRRKILSRASN